MVTVDTSGATQCACPDNNHQETQQRVARVVVITDGLPPDRVDEGWVWEQITRTLRSLNLGSGCEAFRVELVEWEASDAD